MTCTDSAALAFYQENAEYVMSYGTSGMDRDERRTFNKGKAVAAALAAEAYAKANPRRGGSVSWTDEEYDWLAAAYMKHSDRPSILAEFRIYSDRHTDSAVDMMAQICLQSDITVKSATGLNHPALGLLNALNAIEPGRFKGNR